MYSSSDISNNSILYSSDFNNNECAYGSSDLQNKNFIKYSNFSRNNSILSSSNNNSIQTDSTDFNTNRSGDFIKSCIDTIVDCSSDFSKIPVDSALESRNSTKHISSMGVSKNSVDSPW